MNTQKITIWAYHPKRDIVISKKELPLLSFSEYKDFLLHHNLTNYEETYIEHDGIYRISQNETPLFLIDRFSKHITLLVEKDTPSTLEVQNLRRRLEK